MKLVALNWRDLANPLAGGAEVLMDRLLLGFAARGHDVTLVCGGPVDRRPYPVVEAGGTYSQYLAAPVACVRRFASADMVIECVNGVPYFSPLWRHRPTICALHHVHTDQWSTWFPEPVASAARLVESHVLPAVYRSRTFVVCSRSTAGDLGALGVRAERIRVIEPGTDPCPLPTLTPSGEPTYVSLNRLVPHKRIDLLLDTWALVAPQVAGRLVLAGDGPLLEDTRRRAARMERVEVLGRVSEEEKWRLLAEARLHVSASHHEGWGMSITEAAAAGTTSIGFDVPGVRDAIVDEVTGRVVGTVRDQPAEALARAWVDLAGDPDRCAQLSKAARERSDRFTWERVVDRWLEVIAEAIVTWPSGVRRRPLDRADVAGTSPTPSSGG